MKKMGEFPQMGNELLPSTPWQTLLQPAVLGKVVPDQPHLPSLSEGHPTAPPVCSLELPRSPRPSMSFSGLPGSAVFEGKGASCKLL